MIYLFVNFLLLFFSFFRRRRAITCIVVITLLFFWGLGYANGTDWIGYYANYVSLHVDKCIDCDSSFEVGYNFIVKTLGIFGFFSVVLFCAVFNIFSIIRFSKFFKYPYFFIFCIFSMYGWFLYVEQIRQALALSIILFGIPSLYSKRALPYVFSVFFACFFHSSAAFALIFLLPFYKHRITVPLFVGTFLVLPAIVLVFFENIFELIISLLPPNTIVFNKLLFYYLSDNYSAKLSLGIGVLGDILFLIVFLTLGLRREHSYKDDLTFFGTFIFMFILVAGKFQSVFLRLAYYAFPFVAVYCSVVMKRYKDSDYNKFGSSYLIRCLVFGYFIAQIFRPFITHPVNAYDVSNYRSALFHIQDIDDSHYSFERFEKCKLLDKMGYGYLCGY